MSFGADDSGAEPGTRLAQASWVLHEWACQPFFSLVVIFLFAPYFVGHLAADPVSGQPLWGYAHALAGLAIMFLAPLMGAIADAGGPRKPWILACTLVACLGCCALWLAVPGASPLAVLAAVALASVAIECLFVLANAMLPSISSRARIGVLSGAGVAMGQLAGIVALAAVVACAGPAEAGRLSGPVAGAWLAVFMLPLLLFVPDRRRCRVARMDAVGAGIGRLVASITGLRRRRNVFTFLVARVLFHAGLNIVYLFGGILAAAVFSWEARELVAYGVLATLFAATGAAAGGLADRHLGARSTLVAALLLAVISFLVMLSCERDRAFFVPLPAPVDAGLLATAAERAFLGAAAMFGFAAGAAMAASRALFARIAPADQLAGFFGLYAFSAHATAFVGPLVVGLATTASANQKLGLLVAVPLLLCGTLLLARVREPDGDGVARRIALA